LEKGSGLTRTRVLVASTNSVVTTLAGSAAGILLSIIVARSLGPAGKGVVDLITAVSAVAVLGLGLSAASGITYVVARGDARAERVPLSALASSLVIGLATVGALEALAIPLRAAGVLPDGGNVTVVLAGLLTAVGHYQSVTRAALAGSQRVIRANNTELLGRLLALLAGVGAAVVATPAAFVTVLVASGAAAALLQTIALHPRGSLSRVEIAAIVRYSLPSYAANLLQFLNYRLDLFLIAAFRGPQEVGWYAVAGSLVQLIWVVYRSAAAVLFPAFASRSAEEQSPKQLAEAARLAFLVALVAAVALAIVAAWAIPFLYGPDFTVSVLPLLLLLPGAVALTPAGVAAAYFLARGEPGVNARISMAAFAVTVTADVLLIPQHGMVGAAVASSLSYLATLLLTLTLLSRRYQLGVRDLLVPSRADIRRLYASALEVIRDRLGSTRKPGARRGR
jgi:O-antigen/teichoic acid export membrane protein